MKMEPSWFGFFCLIILARFLKETSYFKGQYLCGICQLNYKRKSVTLMKQTVQVLFFMFLSSAVHDGQGWSRIVEKKKSNFFIPQRIYVILRLIIFYVTAYVKDY